MKILLFAIIFLTQISFAQDFTVSGISSGAYMAQQFHTAFSSQVSGVGLIAGGPFYCAKGDMNAALNQCMKTTKGVPVAEESLEEMKKLDSANLIDPVHHLSSAKVWAISGTKDETVQQKVADVLIESYLKAGVPQRNIHYINRLAMGHAFPTENFGNPCPTPSKSPYISQCDLDGAGEILNYLLGPLSPKSEFVKERLFEFDQLRYADATTDKEKLSLHAKAYAYIPTGCERPARSSCPVHIAFHGCRQTIDDIKTTFIVSTGYNEWAEANKIVILYPQAKKSTIGNPNGCWDWWGYSGEDYHTKNGLQMKIVMKVATALKNGTVQLRRAR